MRKISESLFSRYPKTTNPEDLELYDLVAFQHPKGFLIITRFFGYDGDELCFHNLTVPAHAVKEFYILASPLRKKGK